MKNKIIYIFLQLWREIELYLRVKRKVSLVRFVKETGTLAMYKLGYGGLVERFLNLCFSVAF